MNMVSAMKVFIVQQIHAHRMWWTIFYANFIIRLFAKLGCILAAFTWRFNYCTTHIAPTNITPSPDHRQRQARRSADIAVWSVWWMANARMLCISQHQHGGVNVCARNWDAALDSRLDRHSAIMSQHLSLANCAHIVTTIALFGHQQWAQWVDAIELCGTCIACDTPAYTSTWPECTCAETRAPVSVN